MTRPGARAALFAITGVAFLGYWMVVRPSAEKTASMTDPPYVLWFSATLLTLAVALPVFGRMVGGRRAVRWSLIAGVGVGLSSLANIFEDGLGMDGFFFAFILGLLIMEVALLGLTIELVRSGRGRSRLLALIPAGTVVGIILFVTAGGAILFVTWSAAAAVALANSPGTTPVQDTMARP